MHAATLNLDDQLALDSRLGLALELAEERDAAIDLLERLQHRDDARCNTRVRARALRLCQRLECERRPPSVSVAEYL